MAYHFNPGRPFPKRTRREYEEDQSSHGAGGMPSHIPGMIIHPDGSLSRAPQELKASSRRRRPTRSDFPSAAPYERGFRVPLPVQRQRELMRAARRELKENPNLITEVFNAAPSLYGAADAAPVVRSVGVNPALEAMAVQGGVSLPEEPHADEKKSGREIKEEFMIQHGHNPVRAYDEPFHVRPGGLLDQVLHRRGRGPLPNMVLGDPDGPVVAAGVGRRERNRIRLFGRRSPELIAPPEVEAEAVAIDPGGPAGDPGPGGDGGGGGDGEPEDGPVGDLPVPDVDPYLDEFLRETYGTKVRGGIFDNRRIDLNRRKMPFRRYALRRGRMSRFRRRFSSYAARRFRGRGDYSSFMSTLGGLWNRYKSKLLPAVGGAIGAYGGGPGGWQRGWDLGRQVSRFVGLGAYRRRGPGRHIIIKGKAPEMHGNTSGGVRIMHREIIGDIQSYQTDGQHPAAFALTTIRVNPGAQAVFPWLSHIARNFGQYDVNGIVYTYKPLVVAGQPQAQINAVGEVGIASELNVMRAAPLNMLEMQSFQFNAHGKPTQELICGVEEDKRKGGKILNHLLVRADAGVINNMMFYDDAVVYVMVQGCGVNGVNIGQIIASYDITFYNPAPHIPLPQYFHGQIANVLDAAPFGQASTDLTVIYDTLGSTEAVHWVDATHLAFRGVDGIYKIDYVSYNGAAENTDIPDFKFGGSATENTTQFEGNGTDQLTAPQGGAAGNQHVKSAFFDLRNGSLIGGVEATIEIPGTGVLVSITNTDVFIYRVAGLDTDADI